jgi:hypothetical protein
VTATGLLEHPDLSARCPPTGLRFKKSDPHMKTISNKSRQQKTNCLGRRRGYVSHRILVSGLVKEPGTKILQRDAIPL